MAVKVDLNKCTLCGDCVPICPISALEIVDNAVKVYEICYDCSACIKACPPHALFLGDIEESVSLEGSTGSAIWVYLSAKDKQGEKACLEAISAGSQLASELGIKCFGVLIGRNIEEEVKKFQRYGLNGIIVLEHERLSEYTPSVFSKILADLAEKEKPLAIIFGDTVHSKELAGRIGMRFSCGIVSQAAELNADPSTGKIQAERSAYHGIVEVKLSFLSQPQIITIAGSAFSPASESQGEGIVVKREVLLAEEILKEELLSLKPKPVGKELKNARNIVCIGEEIEKEEDKTLVSELASAFNAELVGTKKACERGFIPDNLVVENLGKPISPELYIACGVLGSPAHNANVHSARTVVALTSKEDVPVLFISDFAIIGNIRENMKALIAIV